MACLQYLICLNVKPLWFSILMEKSPSLKKREGGKCTEGREGKGRSPSCTGGTEGLPEFVQDFVPSPFSPILSYPGSFQSDSRNTRLPLRFCDV